MKNIAKLLPILLIPFMLIQCNDLKSTTETDLHFEGEVTYMEIEGGFWAIQNGNETYEPTNLPEEFQKNGLEVLVYANHAEKKASIRMVGPIINIEKISKR